MPEHEPQFNKPKEEEKSEFPIGEARELNEMARKNWKEHLLLFSEVENRVIEVNPNLDIPLKLEEGKPSPLGVFIEASFQKAPPEELPKGKRKLEVWPAHQRSAMLDRVIFADNDHEKGQPKHLYRDIDIKGIGGFTTENWRERKEEKIFITYPNARGSSGQYTGLLNRDVAMFFDYPMSEAFHKAGIRSHRVLATIELDEIIANGKKISVKKAKKDGIIDEEFFPVAEIRAFGTKFRIDDINETTTPSPQKRGLIVRDAKKLVSRELGREENISDEEYFDWFAKTLGRNIGLMHKNGWDHGYLTEHNITLDCRIVDLDSVKKLANEDDRQEDLDVAQSSLAFFTDALSMEPKKESQAKQKFIDSYDAVFPKDERDKYFTNIKQSEETEE